jgi:hypothetical protein
VQLVGRLFRPQQPGTHGLYLQECCTCKGSRGSDRVWRPCASEGGAGDAMPSWQRRDSVGTGGAFAPDALCGACGKVRNMAHLHFIPKKMTYLCA